jgi:hypothetical protein
VTNAVTDALQSFSNSAMCQWMAGAGVQNAVGWVQGGAAILPSPYTRGAAVALTALQYGCNFDPGPDLPPVQEGCQGRAVPTLVEFYDPAFNAGAGAWLSPFNSSPGDPRMQTVSLINGITGYEPSVVNNITYYYAIANFTFADGTSADIKQNQSFEEKITQLRMFDNGSECIKQPDPDPGPLPPDPVEPITGYSPILNCTLTATLNGFRLNSDGTASPIITYTTDQTTQRRIGSTLDNPIIEGCNWYGDLVYTGPPGS